MDIHVSSVLFNTHQRNLTAKYLHFFFPGEDKLRELYYVDTPYKYKTQNICVDLYLYDFFTTTKINFKEIMSKFKDLEVGFNKRYL